VLRRLYDWTLDLAARPYAMWAIALIAFVESSVFPIPPDVVLIPMILAARDKAWKIAAVCTAASVIGGLAGYGIGHFLFDEVGRPMLAFYHYDLKFSAFRETYNEWGAWAVFIAGVTPFPYKVITILSGATSLDLPVFILSSVLARGFRFFIVAALLWYFGASIRAFIEKRLGLLLILFTALLVGGFVILKFVL
jgi:membrane protein YqaA with SNARE-associated domain